MTERTDGGHFYGTADPANRAPPGTEGLRGERATGNAPPGLAHVTSIDGGRSVTVEETSGSAYAEATGVAGLTANESPAPPRVIHLADAPAPDVSPGIRALLTVAGLTGGYLLGRALTRRLHRPAVILEEQVVETVIVTQEPAPALFVDPLATEAADSPALAAHPS